MKNVIWDRPVEVHGVQIFGPRVAWDLMLHGWPAHKDMNFAVASETILAALDGRGCPDLAREKFEEALMSAQLDRRAPTSR